MPSKPPPPPEPRPDLVARLTAATRECDSPTIDLAEHLKLIAVEVERVRRVRGS